MELNNGGYLCFSIYHTSWIKSEPKKYYIWVKYRRKVSISRAGHSEVNSTRMITSWLANSARGEHWSFVLYKLNRFTGDDKVSRKSSTYSIITRVLYYDALFTGFNMWNTVLTPSWLGLKAAKSEIQEPSTWRATLFRCKFGPMFPVFHLAWSTYRATKTFVAGWRKLLRKVERGSTLSNKLWLCCSFFIKLTTCRATNVLVY